MKRIEASAPTSERRDERIDGVIEKNWEVITDGSDQLYFSCVKWAETLGDQPDDDKTTVTIWCRQDDKAEAVASELRGCGCVVNVHDEKAITK